MDAPAWRKSSPQARIGHLIVGAFVPPYDLNWHGLNTACGEVMDAHRATPAGALDRRCLKCQPPRRRR